MAQDSKTLFVRGLSWYTDEHELRAYFEQFGPTERCVVARDRDTNKSRGFGFVTFETVEDTEKALSVEHELSNRTLYAQISIPRERTDRRDDNREMETHKLYCGNLPESVGSMDLGQYFQELAEVVDATVMMDRETGRSRGFGFVAFSEDIEPERISEIMGSDHQLDGKDIRVHMAFRRADYSRPSYNNDDNEDMGFGGGGSALSDDDSDIDTSTRTMFRCSMPTPGTPGWPGMTGLGSSFRGVRTMCTFSGLDSTPMLAHAMRANQPQVNLLNKKPAMRLNGSVVRSVMMKILK